MGTEVATVKKHDDRAGALFEVAGADTVNVDKFFIDHHHISRASAGLPPEYHAVCCLS